MRGARQALLIALFLAGLAAPSADKLLRPDSARDTRREGHNPAPAPDWGWSSGALRAFPARFEQHFADTLGGRDWLLRANTLRQIEIFGRAPSTVMRVGRDGWWYHGEEFSLTAERAREPLDERELESWRVALEQQRDWLRARGIALLIVFGPDKETVYPEHLAPGSERVHPTRLEQFSAYMRAHSAVEVLDLLPALAEEKRSDRGDDLLYHRLGTHWTSRGAWVASREIVRALREHIPELVPLRSEDFESVPSAWIGDTAAPLFYAPDDYKQQCFDYPPRAGYRSVELGATRRPGEILRECKGAPARSCLMLHDSFGRGVDRYLAEEFEHFRQCTQATLDEELVLEAQPQVVIELFVERKLLRGPLRLNRKQDPAANRARFASSRESLYRWDGTQESGGFEGLDGARVEADPPSGCVRISTSAPAQTVLIPPLPFPRSEACILRLALDSPAAQILDVFYQHAGDDDYDRSRSFQIDLAAGLHEVFWRLEDRELSGRLRIRPRLPGRIGLHGIELRAVPGD